MGLYIIVNLILNTYRYLHINCVYVQRTLYSRIRCLIEIMDILKPVNYTYKYHIRRIRYILRRYIINDKFNIK